MAESPEASRPTVDPGERPGLGIRTRYGLTLEPSEELQDLIIPFLRPEAVRRVVGRQGLRFGIAMHQVEVIQADRKSAHLASQIRNYEKATTRYKKGGGVQFRLPQNGFEYIQRRGKNGALTSLSFELSASSIVRGGIMRPPFFDDADHELRAHIVFPTEYVVPNADEQAEELQMAMHAEHPSARDGLAYYGLHFWGLQVLGREVRPVSALRIVRSGDEA